MAKRELDSMATSVFCENLAMMFSAGIPSDEAIALLVEDAEEGIFRDTIVDIETRLGQGSTLAHAIADSGRLPAYAATAIVIGEESGRVERTLRQLAAFYSQLDDVEQRLRGALVYPTVLLLLMAGILAVMLFAVLPAFTGVYESLAGDIATSAYSYIGAAKVIIIVALAVTVALALVFMGFALLAERGGLLGAGMLGVLLKLPFTRRQSDALVRARFTGILATLVSSGLTADEAFTRAARTVESPAFAAACERCETRMRDGESMAQAIYQEHLLEPLYARMLVSGSRSGQTEDVLQSLSTLYYQEARNGIDDLIGTVEPTLAGFLTVAVGMSLLAIMLPLVGIMGGIG